MPSVNLIKIRRELCWIGKIDCIALGMMAGITQILQEIYYLIKIHPGKWSYNISETGITHLLWATSKSMIIAILE